MALEQDLAALLGPKGWLTEDTGSYQTDWLKLQSHAPLGVARPQSTAEVAGVMRLAHAAGVPVTPQGGNTSLCAGAVPGAPGHVILSLSRMNKIEPVDPLAFSVTVEAGAVLASVHQIVEAHDLIFPMHLGAEGSAQIGGLIATNAGGSHALRYGMMQDLVLGLEVVTPDGRIWNGLRPLLKDNAGYQLRRLFCGSEGTLGVVTRAALRLYPAPVSRATALLAVEDFETLVRLGAGLRRDLGEFISALEFFCESGLEMLLRNVSGLDYPLSERTRAYVLVELSTSARGIDLSSMLEEALGAAFETGLIVDGAVAANDTQRAAMWHLREEMPEGQRLEGAQVKHDISVPVAGLSQFIDAMEAELEVILPGVRLNPFGHLGDGNIHFNLSPPAGMPDFGDNKAALSYCLYRSAEQAGGSFAAEHGLGRSKTTFAQQLRSPEERDLMAAVKRALDPENLLNPGVILPAENPQE
ncbi:FAD-binding oxidoreductase [Ruegeria sp. 2012CJ41-6]|uniref:FAD-binding oxidoreductase n=1 Tax=Ruegeria spongiae TaxID=2942209 RepID=A0ABT0Q2Z6_9RHOB|nr:FAD-binding oxidoreductase [Ruegeria spongiae]MCL6284195.1 FAD-binding oxidoreductase [Ruegeria spongiae]